ncbi:MAG: hypothetical protein AAFP90_21335 [Planctomycetota bacterium]
MPASASLVLPETGPIRERANDDPEIGFLEQTLPFDPKILKISGGFRECRLDSTQGNRLIE